MAPLPTPTPPPAFAGLPDLPAIAELRSRTQWVAWRYDVRPGQEKPTKPPVNPHTGFGASHSDPRTWGTYEQAVACAGRRGLPGVGYVMSDDDDLTGADLDACRDAETGALDDWAAAIVALAETYTEVSPSGTGLRIIWRGKIAQTIKADPMHVEIYRNKRFLTITGAHVAGTPEDIRQAPKTEAALVARVAEFRAEREIATGTPVPRAAIHTLPGSRGGSEFFSRVNTAALANLPRWVPSIFPSAHAAPNGALRVSSRDLARDLQEDLSFSPTGIVDFGIHDMGDARDGKRTPIDICLEFGGHVTAKSAAFWLCDRLGAAPASLGWTDAGMGGDAGHGAALAAALVASANSDHQERALSDLEWFDDVRPVIQVPYVVKGVIDEGTMSVVYGPSNSGKTFFALDLAFAVANGGPWRDRRVSPGGVLYLAAEGGNGIANRISALRDVTGLTDVPFALRRAGLDLLRPEADVSYVIALAKEVETRAPLAVIVVDTLSRVIAGGDENAAADMTAFIRNIDTIRAATGAHIMIVHHTGKDAAKGARGHSSLRAATDTEIELLIDEFGTRVAKVNKQRDYEGGEEFAFALKPIVLGTDQDGDEVSTCVVETVERVIEEGAAAMPPRDVCRKMLLAIENAWKSKNPLSVSAQTKNSERYAARFLAKHFEVRQTTVQRLLIDWIDNEVVITSMVDEHSRKRGLKVLSWI